MTSRPDATFRSVRHADRIPVEVLPGAGQTFSPDEMTAWRNVVFAAAVREAVAEPGRLYADVHRRRGADLVGAAREICSRHRTAAQSTHRPAARS